MKNQKRLSLVLIVLMIFTLFSFNGSVLAQEMSNISEVTVESTSYIATGYEATDVRILQEGNAINDFQIGFKPPSNQAKRTEVQNKFNGWLVIHSTKSLDEAWNHLKTLSPAEISDYSVTSGTNRIYRITNYSWADGAANTYRANQKDVVTGAEFGPGLFHFYVATYTTDGIVGLAKADKSADIKPYPKNVTLQGSGTSIQNYSVNYSSFNHPSLTHNFIFYSKDVIYRDSIQSLFTKTKAEIQQLSADNKGKLVTNLEGPISFNSGQKEINGTPFGSGVYYVYVATVGDNGILRISQAIETIVTAAPPLVDNTPIGDGKGTAFVIGGSTSQANYDYAKNLINKPKPRIAIFNSSRDDLATVINHFYYEDPTYSSLEKSFAEKGFEPVFIPLAIDSAYFVANHPYYADLVKTCDIIWLQGGDQNKHARSLLNDDGSDTLILEAIRFVYNRGGVVAGTSAGMHVMSNPSFGYGTPYEALKANNTEFYNISDIPVTGDLFPVIDNNNLAVPGIGIVPNNVLNDTHFDARGRLGRFLVGLRDTGKEIGIGSDEGTGLAIKNNIGTVVGLHGVFIVDVSNANFGPKGTLNVFSVTGVKVHYLTEGDTYSFTTKEVTIGGGKTPIVEKNTTLYSTNDIFGKYETTKAMISLANNTATSLTASVSSLSPPNFIAIFKKNANSKAYGSTLSYQDTALSGYKKTSIVGMMMELKDPNAPSEPIKPIITGVTHYSYQDEVWIVFDENIDPATVNRTNVQLGGNTYYSSSWPKVDPRYPNEIGVRGKRNFRTGDRVTISGVKNLEGVAVETQTWERASNGTWFKLTQ